MKNTHVSLVCNAGLSRSAPPLWVLKDFQAWSVAPKPTPNSQETGSPLNIEMKTWDFATRGGTQYTFEKRSVAHSEAAKIF